MNRTALQVISDAYANRENDHLRLAVNAKSNAIGSWDNSQDRFVVVACLTLDDRWCHMPYELLVNGQRIPETWSEVAR